MTEAAVPGRGGPVFNLPPVVTALLVALILVHALRSLLLSPGQDVDVLLLFSFIPVRYHADVTGVVFPGGRLAELWTPLTYGLLHGDWTHLAFNGFWLAAFGSALARRFGTLRFLAFSALATGAGAAAHYLAHPDDLVPVVGASAAISGHMAAVARFFFRGPGPRPGPLVDRRVYLAPALPLSRLFGEPRVLVFLGVWLVFNLVFGLGGASMPGVEGTIAWEAHMGGFLFGLLAFSLFDPVGRRPVQSWGE